MTVAQFRRLALRLPEAVENSHMGHPDFRVNNKVFATLAQQEGETCGMLKLTPAQQAELTAALPDAFSAVPGGWGERGATYVKLGAVDEATVREALFTAWAGVAPRRLLD